MAAWLVDIASWALLLAGSFFFVVGAAGLVRMPDFYTRMHAASVTDTLGAGLMIAGMMLQAGFTLVSVKLFILGALFFLTGPVATHALAQSALHMKLKPVLDKDGDIADALPDAAEPGPQADGRRS